VPNSCQHRWVRDQTFHVATGTVTDTVACDDCGEPPPGPRLKRYALIPEVRLQVCDHPSGFAYSGKVPCTGPRLCYLCGTNEKDAISLKESA
jgi:hypothetical protein